MRIFDSLTLDGGGKVQSPYFQKELKGTYNTILEWCSGPGYIGFDLFNNGFCGDLILLDINPDAIECNKKTIKTFPLIVDQERIKVYQGEITDLPEEYENKIDLVVANPPNYFNINKDHEYYNKDDLRPGDNNWDIHRKFYNNIGKYLSPDGEILISEVEPFKKKVYINGLYDTRLQEPIIDFMEMINDNDLIIKEIKRYLTLANIECYFFRIGKTRRIKTASVLRDMYY